MPRNISFSMTKEQFLDGSKDVTRRMGWLKLKAGDTLQAVEKAMGLKKKGETVKTLGTIRVVSVRREPLAEIENYPKYGIYEVAREGFPDLTAPEFISFFCTGHKGCTPDSIVTRIEFTRFYGAECGSYPNCAGGCGCGCTKEVERSRHPVGQAGRQGERS